MAACSCNSCCSTTAIRITYSERFCVLSFPACNVHVPYCHLCPDQFYSMFPHCLLYGSIKKSCWIQNVWFDFLYNTFGTLRKIDGFVIKHLCRSSRKVPIILVRFFMKIALSRQLKNSNIKFHENSSSVNWVVECGLTDRQVEINGCFFAILWVLIK
jgi:hypothetical protein